MLQGWEMCIRDRANSIGNKVEIDDVLANSAQGDKEALDILARMGLSIQWNKSKHRIVPVKNIGLKATVIDGSQCPCLLYTSIQLRKP